MEAHCISATPRASRAWSVRFNPKIFLAKDFLRERGTKTFNIMLAPRHPCAHYENFADFQIGNYLYSLSLSREIYPSTSTILSFVKTPVSRKRSSNCEWSMSAFESLRPTM